MEMVEESPAAACSPEAQERMAEVRPLVVVSAQCSSWNGRQGLDHMCLGEMFRGEYRQRTISTLEGKKRNKQTKTKGVDAGGKKYGGRRRWEEERKAGAW